MRKLIKEVIGTNNIRYIKSFFRNRQEREAEENMVAFYSKFFSKGDLFFDVGANFGNRIRPALRIGAKVVAIEPQKQCYQFLEKKFGARIKVIKKGLGKEEGNQELYISSASTISSFSQDWIDAVKKSGRFSNYTWNTKEKVEITTLDNLIAQFGIPKFIKIDVEGYELEVLKGLSQPINYISLEYTLPERTQQIIKCIERLDQVANNTVYNFSVGETMQFGSSEWMQGSEIINLIQRNNLAKSGFGDIYARTSI